MKIYSVALFIAFLLLNISEAVFGANGNHLMVVDSDAEETDSNTPTPSEDDVEYEKFVPTKEWQTIKPGQAIPAGLHVRIDLQSRKKEAKLLDENTHDDVKISSVGEEEASQHSKKFSQEELKEALKLLKNEVTESEETTKKKFRSIEELKKEFASAHLSIKTEAEILAELIEKYQRGHNKIPILQDLEFLLHQYDLAQDFVKMGGINLLLPDFNSTESRIRSLVAFTLGSAMQGNPRVQISVLESNAMQVLLRLVSLDESPEVQARALYALSCLLRNFPVAQKKFIQSGGVTALAELFRPQKMSSVKLQVKVVTLLHDLLLEQHLTERYVEESDKTQQEKLRQYKSFQLDIALKENGFCSVLPKLLGAPDHDTQEKVIRAMHSLVSTCKDAFAGSLDSLKSLAESYKVAAREEVEENSSEEIFSGSSDELYFLSLYNSVSDLILNVEQRYKDEL